jgi:hypothetical protein
MHRIHTPYATGEFPLVGDRLATEDDPPAPVSVSVRRLLVFDSCAKKRAWSKLPTVKTVLTGKFWLLGFAPFLVASVVFLNSIHRFLERMGAGAVSQ